MEYENKETDNCIHCSRKLDFSNGYAICCVTIYTKIGGKK